MTPETQTFLRLLNFNIHHIYNLCEVNRRIKVLCNFCLIYNCRVIRTELVKVNPQRFIVSSVLYSETPQSRLTEDLGALGLRYSGDRVLKPKALEIEVQLEPYSIESDRVSCQCSLSWVINQGIECTHQTFISETEALPLGDLRIHRILFHGLLCSVIRSEEESEFYDKFLALADLAYMNHPRLYF